MRRSVPANPIASRMSIPSPLRVTTVAERYRPVCLINSSLSTVPRLATSQSLILSASGPVWSR